MLKSDYSLNLVNKCLALLAGVGISIILARHLGVVLRGEYAYITTMASTIAIVLGLGLNQTFAYFYKHRFGQSAFGIFVRLYLLQFAFHLATGSLLILLVDDRSVVLIVLLLPSLVLYQQFESALSVVNIRLKIWANLALSACRFAGVFLIALGGSASLLPLVLLHAILWFLVPCFYMLATKINSGTRSDMRERIGFIKFSLIPMVTALLVVLNYNVDIVILRGLGTANDLGLYSVAASIMVYIWALPDAVKEVAMSRVARSKDARPILRPLRFTIYGSLVLVLGFGCVGPWFIPLAFGQEFSGSFGIALVLCLGVLSMCVFKIVGVVVLSDGKRVFYFGSLLISVIVNTILNFIFVPSYGAMGAAWSSVASYTLTGTLFLVYFVRVYDIRVGDVLPITSDFTSLRSLFSR